LQKDLHNFSFTALAKLPVRFQRIT